MDSPLPARTNLVGECVRVMRARMAAGEWKGHLPGERRIADLLQVGRDTVRLALQQLEKDRVLSPAEAGSRRRILALPESESRVEARSRRIGMLSPRRLEQLPQPVLLEVDHLRKTLSSKGGTLDLFAPGWYEQKRPDARLERFIEEEACGAWLLYRSSEGIQRWFARNGIPCLIRGYPHPGVDLPHLDIDWQATARHAAGQLWRLGHRRVGILVPTEPLRGVAAAVRGASELGEEGFETVELVENGTTQGVARALTRALKAKNPPTALIATRSRQVATALTWLGMNGIRVPDHISLICLAREPFLEHLLPEITGYRIDPGAVAKLVARRLEFLSHGNPMPGGSPWITPESVKGASVAAPMGYGR